MHRNLRSGLMASIALGLLFSAPVHAADTSSADVKALQQQIQALQKQINKLAAAQQKAATAPAPVANAANTQAAPGYIGSAPSTAVAATAGGSQVAQTPTATSAAPAGQNSSLQNTIYQSTGVKLTAGGYVEAVGIYRSKNQNADQVSNFNTAIPFNNSVNGHQSEFRGTARGTRFSLLAEGAPDADTKLVGYIETDFLGSTNANSIETNSYSPRIRQGFVGYERSDWGFDVYAGQTWSLATLYKKGLSPRSEALPTTIDIALLPGFSYVRGPGLRLVKDFDDHKVSIGFAAESPQVNFGGVTTPTTVTSTGTASSATFGAPTSSDVAPDLIAKVAFDPGFGHYEAFGLMRFFHDNVNSTLHNNTVVGGGAGVGTVMPVVDKYLDFQANAMYGEGIGRYGPALLPDYSFTPNGGIAPVREYMGSFGFIGHPAPTWAPYLFAGFEKALRNDNTQTAYGYGDTAISNAGCYVNNGTCSATTSDVWQVTGGVWKDLYKGSYGNMKLGLQDSITRRNAFSDAAGNAPHSYENIVMTSFRYSPF